MESADGARRARAGHSLSLDLGTEPSPAAALTVAVTLPAAARESFLEGTWDATGMLLDRYEEVEAVARPLAVCRGLAVMRENRCQGAVFRPAESAKLAKPAGQLPGAAERSGH